MLLCILVVGSGKQYVVNITCRVNHYIAVHGVCQPRIRADDFGDGILIGCILEYRHRGADSTGIWSVV
jgi:hypothetical protein